VAYIRLDSSHFPILIIDVDGNYSEEQAREFCEELHEVLMQLRRHAIVVNTESAGMPSLKVRGILRRFIQEHTKISESYCICAAVLVKSPIVKMGVSALFQLKKTNFPMKAFSNRDDALAWASEQVDNDPGPRHAETAASDFHVSEDGI